ncbi:hypothetical protein SCAR479_12146 [Seiridium cardinale]|uniref:Uncharacterized protein n=1 Tax=Seiridium cardinale TaxID=138064 RepID=A0ABR2XBJ8_9PEZI
MRVSKAKSAQPIRKSAQPPRKPALRTTRVRQTPAKTVEFALAPGSVFSGAGSEVKIPRSPCAGSAVVSASRQGPVLTPEAQERDNCPQELGREAWELEEAWQHHLSFPRIPMVPPAYLMPWASAEDTLRRDDMQRQALPANRDPLGQYDMLPLSCPAWQRIIASRPLSLGVMTSMERYDLRWWLGETWRTDPRILEVRQTEDLENALDVMEGNIAQAGIGRSGDWKLEAGEWVQFLRQTQKII